MVTLHEVITFLVSMQISISSLQTHNVNRCGRSRHLARKLSLRRKRSSPSGFNRTLDAINNVFRKFSAFHDETGRLNVDGMNIISNDGSNELNRSRKARVSYKVQRT